MYDSAVLIHPSCLILPKSTGPPTAQPTLAATPNVAQSNSAQRNIVAQSETLSTGNAIRNEHTAGSSQSVSSKQQQVR